MSKINFQTQKKLLQLARNTISEKLGLKVKKIKIKDPIIREKRGVFVTIKKNGQLRGCIGIIEPIRSLVSGVCEMACSVAFSDPRFAPVTVDELDGLRIEISVLTVPKKIDDPYTIKLGVDGVIISSACKKGVFLPQVATETGWSLEEFMNRLCIEKADLPANIWKTNKVLIKIFQSEVFGEEKG